MMKFQKLSKAEMKNVLGGVAQSCGVKIGGTWYPVAGGRSEAEGSLGHTSPYVPGTVTNWCCDSCPTFPVA